MVRVGMMGLGLIAVSMLAALIIVHPHFNPS
jgi:hypothetical protein